MSGCSHSPSHTDGSQLKEEDLSIARSLSHIQHKLLVMSGKGGVGKSSLAVNLAVGLSLKGYQVGLMDVDLHGPSIPRMLGLNGQAAIQQNVGIYPIPFSEHLKVISVEVLMPEKDTASDYGG